MSVNIAELRHISFFTSLADEELRYIATQTRIHQFERGDIIFFEGDIDGAFYYVQHGLVKIFKTSEDGREQFSV